MRLTSAAELKKRELEKAFQEVRAKLQQKLDEFKQKHITPVDFKEVDDLLRQARELRELSNIETLADIEQVKKAEAELEQMVTAQNELHDQLAQLRDKEANLDTEDRNLSRKIHHEEIRKERLDLLVSYKDHVDSNHTNLVRNVEELTVANVNKLVEMLNEYQRLIWEKEKELTQQVSEKLTIKAQSKTTEIEDARGEMQKVNDVKREQIAALRARLTAKRSEHNNHKQKQMDDAAEVERLRALVGELRNKK